MRAGARVCGALVLRMRRARGALDLGPRAGAGIDQLRRLEPLELGLVERTALRLDIRCIPPAQVRALVPVEAEPAQVDEDLSPGGVADARCVQVLDPENDLATCLQRGKPGDEECPRVPQV